MPCFSCYIVFAWDDDVVELLRRAGGVGPAAEGRFGRGNPRNYRHEHGNSRGDGHRFIGSRAQRPQITPSIHTWVPPPSRVGYLLSRWRGPATPPTYLPSEAVKIYMYCRLVA